MLPCLACVRFFFLFLYLFCMWLWWVSSSDWKITVESLMHRLFLFDKLEQLLMRLPHTWHPYDDLLLRDAPLLLLLCSSYYRLLVSLPSCLSEDRHLSPLFGELRGHNSSSSVLLLNWQFNLLMPSDRVVNDGIPSYLWSRWLFVEAVLWLPWIASF